jgi:molybdopterin converting factor small subunit
MKSIKEKQYIIDEIFEVEARYLAEEDVSKEMDAVQKQIIEAIEKSELLRDFTPSLQSQLSEIGFIITDNNLLSLLDAKEKSRNKNQKIILDYYSKNNFKHLKRLFNSWKKQDFLKKRNVIFNAIFATISQLSIKTSSIVVIPALLSQLTGIREDFLESLPEKLKQKITNGLNEERNKKADEFSRNIKDNDERNIIKQKILSNKSFQRISDQSKLIGFSKLGDSALPIRSVIECFSAKYKKKNMIYRNKILHGDLGFINYGNLLNLIRVCLYIDCLAKLNIDINKNCCT